MSASMNALSGEAPSLRHFKLVRTAMDTGAILAELEQHAPLWLAQTGRQHKAPPQRDTHAIPLRGLRVSRIRGRRRRDVHESRYTSISKEFPATVALLEQLAAELNGELGRVRLARLPRGKTVRPHADRGTYYRERDRYHLVVASTDGSTLESGGEQVLAREGELWWFDNDAIHAARNNSSEDRIHLIFDLRPRGAKLDRNRLPPPDAALTRFIADAQRLEAEAVAAAARLYAASRERPSQWQDLLEQNGLAKLAARSPLRALARLCWPELRERTRREREGAIGWCLAELDLRRRRPEELDAAIIDAGGVETVSVLWRSDRDALLYGRG